MGVVDGSDHCEFRDGASPERHPHVTTPRRVVAEAQRVVPSPSPASVDGVRAGRCTPLFARPLTEFRPARDQSSRLCSPSRSSAASPSRSKTPPRPTRASAADRSSLSRSLIPSAADPADPGERYGGDALEHVPIRSGARPVRPVPPGGRAGIDGSTSAHNSPLISRDSGEDADNEMLRTLRRTVRPEQSPTTYLCNDFLAPC